MYSLGRTLVLAGLAASASACLVNVQHVDDPAPAFARAQAEAAKVQGTGKPGSLNVLVYDPSDRELVSVSAPLWLVRKAGNLALDDDGDEGVQFARLCLLPENLEKAGRGVVVEVDEEEGDHVLVWLR
jgi:hypothetical protein